VKLAITADVHLKTEKEVPERYNALRDILRQCAAEGITTLVICGDLFDHDFSNYADFEKLCAAHAGIQFWLLPGNHDAGLSSRNLTGKNIEVFSQAATREVDGRQLLFLPYKPDSQMGEQLAEFSDRLAAGKWVLFSHGDYLQGRHTAHESEEGSYMPLTRDDLQRYHLSRVFLGHIHAASESDAGVIYPGSPCGLDISETGSRHYYIYDTGSGNHVSRQVQTDVVYGSLALMVLPVDDEAARAASEVKNWLVTSGLAEQKKKACLRVKVAGYCRDRSALLKAVEDELAGYRKYDSTGVDISELSTTIDPQRSDIAEKARAEISAMGLVDGPNEPDVNQVLQQALKVIFEG
jgi:DNA repair exonuclease SbcCD nuclease subunit